MSFKLKLKVRQRNDGKSFDVFDTTGAYNVTTNPTGYGTPNLAISDVTTATLTIFFQDATIPTTLNIFPTLPNTTSVSFNVGFGVLALSELPDGVYQVQYKISGAVLAVPFAYSQTVMVLFTSRADCCVDKMLAALDESSCSCCDDKAEKALLASILLEAAKKAACCGQIDNAKKLIKKVNDICNKASQGCGC